MDVSNGESRGARDSSEQTRNASQKQQIKQLLMVNALCYEMSHSDMYQAC